MMDPFATIIRRLSSVPVVQVLAPLYTTGGHPEVTSRSLVIMASKSGDTTETVAAAKALQKLGAPIFSVVGVDGSPLQALSDWCFVYGDGRPQELVLYLFVGALLHRLGSFEAYPRFADQLRNLPAALVDVRQTFDAQEFLRIGAAIYDRRDQIESMADAAVARGFTVRSSWWSAIPA